MQVPCKGFRPGATGVVCRARRRRAIPFCAAFQTGRFRRLHLVRSELCGEVSFAQRRGRSHRVSGGARQPRDRQVRYYSESAQVASRVFATSGEGVNKQKWQLWKKPQKCQSATPPWGGASALALVTGLSIKWGGSCPPSAFARPVSAQWLWLLPGSAFSWPPNLPGSLLHHWRPTHSNQGAV